MSVVFLLKKLGETSLVYPESSHHNGNYFHQIKLMDTNINQFGG
jgi:hypothetical protein